MQKRKSERIKRKCSSVEMSHCNLLANDCANLVKIQGDSVNSGPDLPAKQRTLCKGDLNKELNRNLWPTLYCEITKTPLGIHLSIQVVLVPAITYGGKEVKNLNPSLAVYNFRNLELKGISWHSSVKKFFKLQGFYFGFFFHIWSSGKTFVKWQKSLRF